MPTWKDRNPYVMTALPVDDKPTEKKIIPRYRQTGLLSTQEETPQLTAALGLLGGQGGQDTGLLSSGNQYAMQDYNMQRQQYMQAYQNYIRQLQAEQDDAAQAKMEQGLAKNALKYANSTNNANNAATAAGGSANIGSGIAGNNAALDNGFETMDTSGYNEQSAYIDDAGGAEAVNPDSAANTSSDSGGSYLGAATGALAGYGAGKKNYYTDPAMRSGEDDFGKYHRDYRAEAGGGTLGGVVGYFSDGLANPIVPALVEWIHPYMQDMTRDMIMAGDKAGGAYGAMMVDPIGTWASGRYSNSDLAASSLTPLIAPIAGGKAPEIAQKASGTLDKIGHKIADVFGW